MFLSMTYKSTFRTELSSFINSLSILHYAYPYSIHYRTMYEKYVDAISLKMEICGSNVKVCRFYVPHSAAKATPCRTIAENVKRIKWKKHNRSGSDPLRGRRTDRCAYKG
jgi:hypothetical protein